MKMGATMRMMARTDLNDVGMCPHGVEQQLRSAAREGGGAEPLGAGEVRERPARVLRRLRLATVGAHGGEDERRGSGPEDLVVAAAVRRQLCEGLAGVLLNPRVGAVGAHAGHSQRHAAAAKDLRAGRVPQFTQLGESAAAGLVQVGAAACGRGGGRLERSEDGRHAAIFPDHRADAFVVAEFPNDFERGLLKLVVVPANRKGCKLILERTSYKGDLLVCLHSFDSSQSATSRLHSQLILITENEVP